jgi:hypothetical protein
MSRLVPGVTPYREYLYTPIDGRPNEYGIYPWSNFTAAVGTINVGGDFLPLEAPVSGVTFNFLFFTNSIPSSANMICDIDGSDPAFAIIKNTTGVPYLLDAPAGAAVVVDYGHVAEGYLSTSGIYCSGFPAQGVTNKNANTGHFYNVHLLANSGTICSPVGPSCITTFPVTDGSTVAPIPIILDKTKYTQAMYDAGNIYVNTTNGFIWQIVGLYVSI